MALWCDPDIILNVSLALDGGHSSKAGPSDQDVSGIGCTSAFQVMF
jgi:hypothetical protein